MATTEQRLAELERQVAELSAEVQDLRTQALVFRTITDMRLQREAGTGPTVPPTPPRHLHALQGGAR